MRLIDADELALKLRYMGYMDEHEEVQEVIDESPTIDAVTYEEWFSTNCETCKEYDKEKHCCPKFRGVIKQTLKEFEENNKIVRCMDCKWVKTEHCPFRMGGLFTYSYCSFGEREEE